MTCATVFATCKRPSEAKPFGFRWTDQFARRWEADAPFGAGVRVRPSVAALRAGFEYSSSGGHSNGKKEPRWPAVLGGTVVDGSITWTAVAPSHDGLVERVASVNWPAVGGVTITPRLPTDEPGLQQTIADISGGTAGTLYTITCRVTTTAGNVYDAVLALEIE